MDTFKKQDLERLLLVEAEGCVSIFMPTFKTGPEVQQAPILLKNLTKEAEERLVQLGRRRPEVLDLLKPIEKLTHDTEFWKHQDDGLALFLSPDGFETFRLPVRFEPSLTVDHKLNVRPILPHLHGDGQFYILAISLNDARFFKASKHEIKELEIENLPLNKEQALGLDKSQSLTLNRAPGFSSGVPAHGSLELSDQEKTEIRQYFRKVDQALSSTLKSAKEPMVIAGVDALFHLYREVNTYPHLLGECIKGNPEALTPAQLHIKAWPMVGASFTGALMSTRDKFSKLFNKQSPLVSSKLEEIFFAAQQKRVESLFIAKSANQWGDFDLEKLEVAASDEPDQAKRDLLNAMVSPALLSGANVYVLDLEDMPQGEPLAAVFRF